MLETVAWDLGVFRREVILVGHESCVNPAGSTGAPGWLRGVVEENRVSPHSTLRGADRNGKLPCGGDLREEARGCCLPVPGTTSIFLHSRIPNGIVGNSWKTSGRLGG